MNGFEEYGRAMLLANEGNAQAGAALASVVGRWLDGLRGWLKAMPVSLPPTESYPRK